MGLFSWSKSDHGKHDDKLADGVVSLIALVGRKEAENVYKAWNQPENDGRFCDVWFEVVFILLSVADQLSKKTLSDKRQQVFMAAVVSGVENTIVSWLTDGDFQIQARNHLRTSCPTRIAYYAKCTGIGHGTNPLLIVGPNYLVSKFFVDSTDDEKLRIFTKTSSVLVDCVTALLLCPPFKELVPDA